MSSFSEIVVVLDRSGSMRSAKADHEGGLNSFIEDQKKLDGDVKFTLVQFDTTNPFELVYDRSNIQEVKEVELIPRGGTPLIEAVTRTVAHISDKLNKETTKPDQVVFMIITDGGENESAREFSKSGLKSLIEEKKDKQKWEFLFLGANIDAFGEARDIGVGFSNAINFKNNSPKAVANTYGLLSSKMGTSRRIYRAIDTSGISKEEADAQVVASNCYSFTDEDRAETVV
jgi:uncharacterized protein YegL